MTAVNICPGCMNRFADDAVYAAHSDGCDGYREYAAREFDWWACNRAAWDRVVSNWRHVADAVGNTEGTS